MRTFLTTRALALIDSPCTTLGCKLGTWLHVLYALAAILALVLIVVSLLAYRLYRENKKASLTPQ